ncbi:hypothetical protein AB1286_20610 [Trinickia sp. NRRL B-1857]
MRAEKDEGHQRGDEGRRYARNMAHPRTEPVEDGAGPPRDARQLRQA